MARAVQCPDSSVWDLDKVFDLSLVVKLCNPLC